MDRFRRTRSLQFQSPILNFGSVITIRDRINTNPTCCLHVSWVLATLRVSQSQARVKSKSRRASLLVPCWKASPHMSALFRRTKALFRVETQMMHDASPAQQSGITEVMSTLNACQPILTASWGKTAKTSDDFGSGSRSVIIRVERSIISPVLVRSLDKRSFDKLIQALLTSY